MRTLLLTTTLALLLTTTSRAEDSSGVLNAFSSHEVKLAPQKLRLTMMIRAEGADAKSAIASYMEHKARVKKELVEIKADDKSIEIGSPRLTNNHSESSDEFSPYASRSYARATFNSQTPSENGPGPKIYTAIGTLKAEWPLPTTDVDALALLPDTLADQITTRDFAGKKNKAKLDQAAQEKLEEAQAAQQSSSYDSGEQSQEILFVAKVDEAARKQAIKAAYDKAVAKAKLHAGVTGLKLGALKSLTCDDNEDDDGLAMFRSPGRYPDPYAVGASTSSGPDPGNLRFHVRVNVQFAVAEAVEP